MRFFLPFYQLANTSSSSFSLPQRFAQKAGATCSSNRKALSISPVLLCLGALLALAPPAKPQTAALKGIDCSSSKILPGDSVSCTVILTSAAPAEGVVVGLTTDTGMVTVPVSVIVESGKSMASFTASSSEIAGVENATVTAASGKVQTAVSLAQVSTTTPLELVSKSSGKCLTENGSGVGVDQTSCSGSNSQKWFFVANSDGSYYLKSVANSLRLEGLGVAGKPGEKVIVWQPYSTNSQKWKVRSTSSGYYSLMLEATSMCLGVTSTANAAAAAQYACSGGNGQAWQVVGQQAAGHKVTLAWKPSTSSGVNGYYVYRGTTSGGTLTKLSGKLSATNYVDANVQVGKTYYYATTAANSANQESGYSNKVSATIP